MTIPGYFKLHIARILYQLRLLRHRPRLIANRLYAGNNEFHSSLDLNHKAMSCMNKADREEYINDLVRRRNLAHRRNDK